MQARTTEKFFSVSPHSFPCLRPISCSGFEISDSHFTRFLISLESRAQLCHFVTMCIFTCTGQHASNHLGQVTYVIIPQGLLGWRSGGSNAQVISLHFSGLSSLQLDWCSWIPNGPCTMQKPPPISKDVTEKDIVDLLPNLHQARMQKTFTKFPGRRQPVMVRRKCLGPGKEAAQRRGSILG